MWDLTVSVPDHCLSFYFVYVTKLCSRSHFLLITVYIYQTVCQSKKSYKMVPANFFMAISRSRSGQMSNTNNDSLEFLFTTYDFTIATETIQFTHIIVQKVIHKEIMKF